MFDLVAVGIGVFVFEIRVEVEDGKGVFVLEGTKVTVSVGELVLEGVTDWLTNKVDLVCIVFVEVGVLVDVTV